MQRFARCTAPFLLVPNSSSRRGPAFSSWAARRLEVNTMGLGRLSKLRRGATSTAQETAPSIADGSLLEYISASPLLGVCGLGAADVAERLDEWRALGRRIAENLGFPAYEKLEDYQKRRIYHYYLPVFFWCQGQLAAHRAAKTPGPLVVGISAPQGCGKSTLCEQLEALFRATGASAASVSVDDFYLTHEGQAAVAAAHAGNPLLQMRGNAGTHDVGLGAATLRALRSGAAAAPLPRYDKSAYGGRGDRAEAATWPVVESPVDVVLFEGWMLGFRPVGATAAAAVDPNLEPVDAALQRYEEAWDSQVDCWLVVRVADPECAYRWRLQAEQAMRASGRAAMSDEQVATFVDRFMPAYRCYLPGLYSRGPTTAQPGRLVVVEVEESREPAAQQPSPIM